MVLLCDGCHLPPRPNQKLHKCSRCKSAQYHGQECQKKHYREHRKECLRISRSKAEAPGDAVSAVAAVTADEAKGNNGSKNRRDSFVECRSLSGKGRCIIATSSVDIGCHLLSGKSNCNVDNGKSSGGTTSRGLCYPLAPPVLFESLRKHRCTYCFGRIDHTHFSGFSNRNPRSGALPQLHFHCSEACRRRDQNFEMEERAAQELQKNYGGEDGVGKKITPTVLICSRFLRLFQNSPQTSEAYNQLCHNESSLTQKEKDEYLNIMRQCHVFLLAMSKESEVAFKAAALAIEMMEACSPSDDATSNEHNAIRFVARLTMNGFTVASSEQIPLGVGVYTDGNASMINHSCRPNAIQTFWLSSATNSNDACEQPHPPLLQITACRAISAGEEVTISYCDASSPKTLRSDALRVNYKFDCDCWSCKDFERDDRLFGLQCPKERCKGKVRSVKSFKDAQHTVDEAAMSQGVKENDVGAETTSAEQPMQAALEEQYNCTSCGHSDFKAETSELSECIKKLETFETMVRNPVYGDNLKYSKIFGDGAREIYQTIKKKCDVDTAWYVAWSADVLANWCAEALPHAASERDQLDLCHEALTVVEESRKSTEFCMDYPGNLRYLMRKGVEGKLRLFVNPMDVGALSLLNEVKKELMKYYPPSDEIVLSLEESIASYSFS